MARFDNVGMAVVRLAQRKGWTQARLALESGIPAPKISHYKKGRQLPDLTTLGTLLDALDASLPELEEVLDELDRRPRPARAEGESVLGGGDLRRYLAAAEEPPPEIRAELLDALRHQREFARRFYRALVERRDGEATRR